MSNPHSEIKNVIEKFQTGYKNRKMDKLTSFLEELFVIDTDSMIVGTGQAEWIVGPEQIRNLVENDWKEWSDLTIDTENAHIHEEGTCAWLTTKATCTLSVTMKQIKLFMINRITSTVNDEKKSVEEKLFWLNQTSSKLLYETEQGNTLKFALRLSIILVKRDTNWKIHQMHFSFPNVFFPDGRIKV